MMSQGGLIDPSGWPVWGQILLGAGLVLGLHGGLLYAHYRMLVKPAPPRKLCLLMGTIQIVGVLAVAPFAIRWMGPPQEQATLAAFDPILFGAGGLIIAGGAWLAFYRKRHPQIWGWLQMGSVGWVIVWGQLMSEGFGKGLNEALFKGGSVKERLKRFGIPDVQLGETVAQFNVDGSRPILP